MSLKYLLCMVYSQIGLLLLIIYIFTLNVSGWMCLFVCGCVKYGITATVSTQFTSRIGNKYVAPDDQLKIM